MCSRPYTECRWSEFVVLYFCYLRYGFRDGTVLSQKILQVGVGERQDYNFVNSGAFTWLPTDAVCEHDVKLQFQQYCCCSCNFHYSSQSWSKSRISHSACCAINRIILIVQRQDLRSETFEHPLVLSGDGPWCNIRIANQSHYCSSSCEWVCVWPDLSAAEGEPAQLQWLDHTWFLRNCMEKKRLYC